jgi:hypothetical protein
MKPALLVALLCCLPLSAAAAELQKVNVERKDGVFHLRSEALFDADQQALFEVFADWDLSTQFSSIVVESRNVEADEDGRPRFYSRMLICVTFFCKSFERNGHVELQPPDRIRAVADPDSSDFHVSEESWLLSDADPATRVVYELRVKPKFWVPPVIGPFLIKRKLERDAGDALQRMDLLAQARMSTHE